MELNNFPRDIQDLCVRVSSELDASEIQLMVDDVRVGTLDSSNFRDDQEWTLFNHVEMEHIPEEDQRNKGWATRVERGYTAGRIIAKCRAARQSKFYILNNVLLMFALVVLSLTAFAFDPSWNTSRIGSSMTLLLVAVAYKLSVAGSLPFISYLTYLDTYNLGVMVYLCFITVLFALLTPFKDDMDKARKMDAICVGILALSIIVFHIVYAVVFFTATNKQYREMEQKDKNYSERLDKLLQEEKQRAQKYQQQQQAQQRPTSRQSSVRSGSSMNSHAVHSTARRTPSYTGSRAGSAVVGLEDVDVQTRRPTFGREEQV